MISHYALPAVIVALVTETVVPTPITTLFNSISSPEDVAPTLKSHTKVAELVSARAHVAVPAADNSTGTTGQIAIGADYIYICTATNTWRRIQVTGSGW